LGLFPLFLEAQLLVTGQVRDAQTGAPLAFANVIYDIQGKQGTVTDMDGFFRLELARRPERLRVSHLGYISQTVKGTELDGDPLRIFLSPAETELREVLIAVERDPARALMEQVIAHRNRHDPAALPAYDCRTYTRYLFDWLLADSMERPPLVARSALMVMESETERRYLRPGRVAETVLANRVSGFRAPGFAALATDIQPFSWYEDLLPVLDHNYLNPISPGGPGRYRFQLVDTLVQAGDTLIGVRFAPKPGATADLLQGFLRIHKGDYVLFSVEAGPADAGLIDLRIEQRYQQLADSVWFPEQLNFSLRMPDYPQKGLGVQAEGRSYVQSVNLAPGWRRRDLGPDLVRMAPEASTHGEAYWDSVRVRPLSPREEATYEVIDSLGQANNFDRKAEAVAKLSAGRVPLQHIDVDLNQLWRFNSYEGNRLGLGLTNPQPWWGRLTVGVYGAYGFRDQAWKYGSSAGLRLHRDGEWELGLLARRDVVEPGQSQFREEVGTTDLRSYAAARMDSIDEFKGWMRLRFLTYATLKTGLAYTRRDPAYVYAWRRQPGETAQPAFAQLAWQGQLRYAYREELVEVFGRRVSRGSRFPVVRVAWELGQARWQQSAFEYLRLEGQLTQRLRSRLGDTRLTLEAGWVRGEVPASLLFYGSGARSPEVWLVAPDFFQTMPPYAFLRDRYTQGFVRHTMAAPLWRGMFSQPRLSLFQGVGWGRLSQPEQHEGVAFRSMEKGYFESGLLLDQLLRLNYLNVMYLGLGGGVFYAYGPYQAAAWQDNLVGKVSLTFSSR